MLYRTQFRKRSWNGWIGHHITKKDITIPKTNLARAKWNAVKLPVPTKIKSISQYNFNGGHTQIKGKIQELLKK